MSEKTGETTGRDPSRPLTHAILDLMLNKLPEEDFPPGLSRQLMEVLF
jgi:hypothetical protein